ncbi:UNVERIFIED_CONTAM: hypothetical protein GTU68_005942 [Idotea baltica]|nr:hypothetical protein [Idotea baltica]
MNTVLSISQRNTVLLTMAKLVAEESEAIIAANKKDIETFAVDDLAMFDRLKVDETKIKGMLLSLEQLASQKDPLGQERFAFTHENGLKISNKTASFGTVMIIYESRPDVTIEAGGIAFKSGNKILLKGGKESINSNLAIVNLWHRALAENDIDKNWVEYLNYDRNQTQAFLKNPTQKIDLIIPRGGEKLIAFVKENASCPVIVSGRGNNFIYVSKDADVQKALAIIVNAKVAKISACNALDKVLISELIAELISHNVEILVDDAVKGFTDVKTISNEQIWYEEFLDYKVVIGLVDSTEAAIAKVNKYCGGHSASIVTTDDNEAKQFMESVDAAAVYQNASTRFTDGFEFGLGGELAISTDKLHQRGPIGLQHLVTNKWYIFGDGQIR